MSPRAFDDVAECVESTLCRVGPRIVLALPLGIGKPNPLANEFYRRAQRDSTITLKIFTALSLRAPVWRGELERRFLQPLVERIFGNCVPLDYVRDLHAGAIPKNVEIVEFFLDPGALLHVAHSQRHYFSTNYTHVARDVAAQGVNVIGQLIAKRSVEGRNEYSLGSNPDVTVDLLELLAPQRRRGRDVVVIGEINRQMPFMFGSAAVPAETFDFLVDHSRYDYDLFAPPNQPLRTADHAIGLYGARLVQDGGTLQLGIGALGNAVVFVWSYGNTTIPRHLRDIVITEYGVADLRGRTDQEVIAALLNITDSRFQDALKREAQLAGKLAPDYRIADMHRNNTPQALEERFVLPRARGLFSEFPFGTDLTREEIVLAKALERLKDKSATDLSKARTVLSALLSRGTPASFRPYLQRMELDSPRTREQWLWQRLLVQELKGLER